MSSINKKTTSAKTRSLLKNGSQHVIPEKDHWAVKGAGDVRGTFSTQAEAIAAAKRMARQGGEVIIHSRTGRISSVSDSPTDARMLEIWKSLHKTSSRKK